MTIYNIVSRRARRPYRLSTRQGHAPYRALRREIDSMFNEFASLTPWSDNDNDFWGGFSPRLNVAESDTEIEVTAELPGIDEQDVEITISQDVLTIKGEKKQEQEETEGSLYRMERRYGSFCRSIELPAGVVDVDETQASYKNGVLTVLLPKLEEAQETTKRIAVKAG
jgi:HSP20 family protein